MPEKGELLVLFARAPELGKVKTRLCPPLSKEQALTLHRALVEDTLESLSRLDRRTNKLLLLSQQLSPPGDLIVPPEWSQGLQPTGDLGARLSSVVNKHLAKDARKLVIMGSDSPTLPHVLLHDAFERLDRNDVVIGPAEDGGYYLVGCSRWIPAMFTDIDWGTEMVLSQTKRALDSESIAYDLLIEWYDVDRGEDLERLRKEITYLARTTPRAVPRRVAAALPPAPPEPALDEGPKLDFPD